MDGPWSKNNPDSISITHQPLLARCQRVPHPRQVNEIRCKCRYNGVFFATYKLHSVNFAARPSDLSTGKWRGDSEGRVRVCVVTCKPVRTSWGNQAISQTHLLSGSPAACLFICVPLLIADHTSYVTSPPILPPPPTAQGCHCHSVGGENLKKKKNLLHIGTQTRIITLFSHTRTCGVIWMVGMAAAAQPLTARWSDW